MKWKEVNRYIKEELIGYIDFLFDNTPVLCVSDEESHMAKYGDHPNGEGCKIWAKALIAELKERPNLL